MSPLAERLSHIDASGIRRVFDMAAAMKNPVNLGIGQPHFAVPARITAEAARLTQAGFNAYTPTQGIPDLIAALSKEMAETRGRAPEDLLVTSGVSGGIALSFLSLLNPGDEFIVPDPFFVIYKQLAALAGAKAVRLDTYPDWKIDANRLEALVTPRTRFIVLVSPANPTGHLMSQAEMDDAVAVAKKHDLILIVDHIYDAFRYDRPAFEPVPSAWTNWEKTLYLGGFSKSYALTGWRLGWAAGPAEIVGAMKKLQQYTFVCAPSFAQKASMTTFEPEVRREIAGHVADYAKKRDRVFEVLSKRFEIVKPQGAFYAFVKAPGPSATAFVERCLAREVLVIPGDVFSDRDSHFRLSFAAPDDVLERGLQILHELAGETHE